MYVNIFARMFPQVWVTLMQKFQEKTPEEHAATNKHQTRKDTS